MLWGDGHLRESNESYYASLEIVEDDFVDIKEIFQDWSLKTRSRLGGRKNTTGAFSWNRNFGLFLLKNDYKNKSILSPTKILSIIPENLKHYFWRGYSDADGCFYVTKSQNQYAISGNYDQNWDDLINLANSLYIKYSIRKIENKRVLKTGEIVWHRSSVFRITDVVNIFKFGRYIYEGNAIGLKRKQEKYKEIANRIYPELNRWKGIFEIEKITIE